MFVFTDKYVKGYAFDDEKTEKELGLKAHSPQASQFMYKMASKFRHTYIGVGPGHVIPKVSEGTLKIVFVLDSGDDYEELKNRELKDVAGWFRAAVKETLSGPEVFLNYDHPDA